MRRVLLPASMNELWSCLKKNPQAAFFAGGTDLFVKMRAQRANLAALIGLERIAGLMEIREDHGCIRIGACATHAQLLRHPLIAARLPVLHQALGKLGSPAIREMGTLGGNICTASPAGDTLPALYILDAEVEAASEKGSRAVPLRDFIIGPGKTVLQAGEVLTAVRIKTPGGGYVHHFEKIGQRKSMACAIASLAALLKFSASGCIEESRLAWGSVGPTVVTSKEIDEFLVGKKLSRETLFDAADRITRIVAPIDDIRASAHYRRTVSGNLMLRLLSQPAHP